MREQEESVALVREHAALMDAFQCTVTDARTGHLERTPKQYAEDTYASLEDPRSDLKKWKDVKFEAQRMVNQITGQRTDEETRDILADDLAKRGADPLLFLERSDEIIRSLSI